MVMARKIYWLCYASALSGCSEATQTAPAQQQTVNDEVDSDLTNNDFVTDDEDSGEITSIEDLLKQCGLGKNALENEDTEILDKVMYSWPKVVVGSKNAPLIGNVNYKVRVITKLKINATMGKTTTQTDFEIEATPSAAQSEAEAAVAEKRGKMTSYSLPYAERQEKLADNEDWDGITCAVGAVEKTESRRGGSTVEAEYDPPFPASVNPKADLSRYEEELGDGRSFETTATVTRSNNPAVRKGKKYEGTVTIERVKPNLVLDAGSSGQISVPADIAYRLEFDFGDPEITAALGHQVAQTIFIDVSKHDMAAIVVDAGEDGMLVLSDEFDGI